MKLINRDKFINDMFDLYLDAKFNPQDVHFSLLDVRSNIDSPEYEVEAIPVEWLQHKLIDYVCSGKYGSDSLPIVYSLIADWRKENEQNRSGV